MEDVYGLFPRIFARQLSEYRISLAITENPHRKEPNLLWEEFDKMEGKDYIHEQKLDKQAFEAMRQKVAKGGRVVVK